MNPLWLKNSILFLALFGLLCLPALLMEKKAVQKEVIVQYPVSTGRDIASEVEAPDFDNCKPAQRWRYKCNEDRTDCKKDRQETYMLCKSL